MALRFSNVFMSTNVAADVLPMVTLTSFWKPPPLRSLRSHTAGASPSSPGVPTTQKITTPGNALAEQESMNRNLMESTTHFDKFIKVCKSWKASGRLKEEIQIEQTAQRRTPRRLRSNQKT